MITFIIIYLIGCITAFFLTAYINDCDDNSPPLEIKYNLFSWFFVLIFLYFFLEEKINQMKFFDKLLNYKPSLKPFKNLFKKKN